jgi:hypothetical protein
MYPIQTLGTEKPQGIACQTPLPAVPEPETPRFLSVVRDAPVLVCN